uniref:Uncharacterized protein n=1 Tax=Globodera rostochiensis TaxID=31243 RepID=A0A914HNY9_GLORO
MDALLPLPPTWSDMLTALYLGSDALDCTSATGQEAQLLPQHVGSIGTVSLPQPDLPLQTFDELFVEEWWDKDEAEDLKMPPPTNFGQNVHHQIDRQNTQIGQSEPNSTDQLGQIEPNSNDQNPPHAESDHSNNAKNGKEQSEIMKTITSNAEEEGKHETVAKELGLSFVTIYNWKNELGQTARNKHCHSEQKELMKRFYKIKDKNPKIRDEEIAKMLKIGISTLYRWKKQFKHQQFHPNSVD